MLAIGSYRDAASLLQQLVHSHTENMGCTCDSFALAESSSASASAAIFVVLESGICGCRRMHRAVAECGLRKQQMRTLEGTSVLVMGIAS